MRLGIVVALPAEARILHRPGLPTLGAVTVLSPQVSVCRSGPGPERAARAAHALLRQGADRLLSFGVGGGADPALASGDLLLPARIDVAGSAYVADPVWRMRLRTLLQPHLPCHDGVLYSTPLILNRNEKQQLARTRAVAAVDMESGAVASVAQRAGCPCLVLRAIADPADFQLPMAAIRALDPDGRARVSLLARALLRRPAEIFSLWTLARYFRGALGTLNRVTRIVGTGFAAIDAEHASVAHRGRRS